MIDTFPKLASQQFSGLGDWSLQKMAILEEITAATYAAVDIWNDNPGSTYLDEFGATPNRHDLVGVDAVTPRPQVLQDLAALRARHQTLANSMTGAPTEAQGKEFSDLLDVEKQIAPALFKSVKLLIDQLDEYAQRQFMTTLSGTLGNHGFETDLSQSRDDKGLFRADLHFRSKGTDPEGAAPEEKG